MLLSSLINEENIFLIFEVVATNLPQLRVVNVRRNDLAVPPNAVFSPHQLHQLVVNDCSMGIEECTSRRKCGKVEKLLLGTDDPVIPFSQLLLLLQVIIQLRLLRIRNRINSLQIIVLLLTQPIRRRILSNLKSFDAVGGG